MRCIRTYHSKPRLQAVSLFSSSVEQNARDTQMTTRVTEGNETPSVHAPRGLAAQRSREHMHSPY